MKCIILAAGYATRLYPLTENYPKPLLEVKNKKILDYLIEDLETSNLIDKYVVVSNHKFIDHFNNWKDNNKFGNKLIIIDDGSTNNDNRLGAVNDIKFAIDSLKIDEDILVIAGDNLLDFSLVDFLDYAMEKKSSCVMRKYESDLAKLQRTGVLEIGDEDKVLSMEEKPKNPKSNYACPPFYYYAKDVLMLIDEAIKNGCNVDAPGSLVSWLCSKCDIYAYLMPGNRYDIGNIDSYNYICENYNGISKNIKK